MSVPRPNALTLNATLSPAAPEGALQMALTESGAPGTAIAVADVDAQAFHDAAAALFATLRLLLQRGWLHSGAIERQDSGPFPCPDVPLVRFRHAAAFSMAEVTAHYAQPDALLNVPGATCDRAGDTVLIGRALHARSDFAFFAATLPGQWYLARAARPGAVSYEIPAVPDWARSVFYEGERSLREVIYQPATAELTLSFAGGHVRGWEVYWLRAALAAGALPDGQPLRAVKVMFLDEVAAREEARPLLEIGAKVRYFDSRGVERELT